MPKMWANRFEEYKTNSKFSPLSWARHQTWPVSPMPQEFFINGAQYPLVFAKVTYMSL